MHADITRNTFRPERHYVGLLTQQGRVHLDADFNEQADIDRYRRRQLGSATIGPTGVEKTSGAFGIEVAPGGLDLLIRPGRMWVQGRLCENTPSSIGAQATGPTGLSLDTVTVDGRLLAPGDWIMVRTATSSIGPLAVATVNEQSSSITTVGQLVGVANGASGEVRRVTSLNSQPYSRERVDVASLAQGQYAIVIDAWDREVTALDDPAIAETALNGSDTATRLQSAWRVELIRVGPAAGATCATAVAGFPPAGPDGRLAVFVDTATAGSDPCILPDAGGYRGLEHQLYRVEVHRVIGTDVVLKWQRDNANLVSRVDVVGTTFRVDEIGRDVVSGFQEVGFVELTDERLMLANRSGDLLKVQTINRATRQIEIDTTFAEPLAETSVALAQDGFRPRARRWDGRLIASTAAPATPLELERGLFVRIEAGEFREGDYWLIPARTATIADPSSIEWPRAEDGTELAVRPHGVAHDHAKLALVNATASAFVATSVLDCRPQFPALTDIAATDVSVDPTVCGFQGVTNVQEAIDALCGRSAGTCTRTAVPGPGWESVFTNLPAGQSAEVCFPVGTFPLGQMVQVVGVGGHLLVHGAGWGSAIAALASDSALLFRGWDSVTVRDLFVQAGDGGERPRPNPNEGLRGALSFHSVADVTVEHLRVRTAPRSSRATSAVSVYGASGASTGTNRARIAHCSFEVGEKQVGVLAVDVGRFLVEDNVMTVVGSTRVVNSVADLVAEERNAIGRLLLSDLRTGPAAGGGRPSVLIAGVSYTFATLPDAVPFWSEATSGQAFATMAEFKRFASRMKNAVIGGRGDGQLSARLSDFLNTRVVRRRTPVMSQGIVAGGRALGDVTIHNNHVGAVIRGIHVGVSHEAPRSTVGDVGDRIVITNNRVAVTIPAEGARGRHGIFCGNAEAVTIRANELTFTSLAPGERITSTGIRVFGFIDRMMNVRENLVQGFDTSISVFPLLPRGPGQLTRTRLYQIRENTLVQAGPGVRIDGPLQSKVTVADNAGG